MKFELFVPDASPKIFEIDEGILWNISPEGEMKKLLGGSSWLDTVDLHGHPYRVRAGAVTHYSPVTDRMGMRSTR